MLFILSIRNIHSISIFLHRKIIEMLGIKAFSMQEVDKFGIKEVVERALKAVDPK